MAARIGETVISDIIVSLGGGEDLPPFFDDNYSTLRIFQLNIILTIDYSYMKIIETIKATRSL